MQRKKQPTQQQAVPASFNIADVLEIAVSTPFEYRGTRIEMEVYIERITPEFRERLAAATDKSEEDAVRALVVEAAKSWSLNWNGQPFPPTYENTSRCPYSFLAAAANAVLKVWSGDPTNATNSLSTSAQMEAKDASQPGT